MSKEINLNQIELFREVVLAGSFSKTATRLRMPKSRVSRHIAQLEAELGVPLIYRTTRQFRLTEAGSSLFQKASPLLNELKNAVEEVSADSEEIAGMIKVTVPEDIGCELMAKICFEFMQLHPKVEIGLHSSNQMVDLVKNSIDVAVRVGPAKDSTLIRRKLGQVGLILVASPDFLERHASVSRIDDLEKLPYLAFSPPGVKKHTLRMTNGRDTKSIHLLAQFSCNNFFVLRSMALLGMGFAPMPAFLASEAIGAGSLQQVMKEWIVESNPVQILIPQQKEVPPRIRAFVDFLSKRLGPAL